MLNFRRAEQSFLGETQGRAYISSAEHHPLSKKDKASNPLPFFLSWRPPMGLSFCLVFFPEQWALHPIITSADT